MSRPARIVLLIIALGCFAFTVPEIVRDKPAPAGGMAVARGQVVAVDANAVRYRFVADADDYEGVRLGTDGLTAGQPVTVLYEPGDPQHNWSGAGDVDELRAQYSRWRSEQIHMQRWTAIVAGILGALLLVAAVAPRWKS